MHLTYVVSVLPYAEILLNRLEIFDEVCIYIVGVSLYLLSDFGPLIYQFKANVGYFILSIMALNTVIHLCITLTLLT